MTFIGYRMTHDSGFAPNPYFEELTLATCKPAIRRTKDVGSWVAGFVSKALVMNSNNEGVTVPYQALIYLMKVGEVKTYDEYFNDSRFEMKKPIKNHADLIRRSGDNIYRLVGGKPCQLPNNSHDDDLRTIDHDVGGVNVLVADKEASYYFGRNCQIPEKGWEDIGFKFSKGRTFYCTDSDLENIRDFLRKRGFAPGIHGKPCLRVESEGSTTHCGSCSKS